MSCQISPIQSPASLSDKLFLAFDAFDVADGDSAEDTEGDEPDEKQRVTELLAAEGNTE